MWRNVIVESHRTKRLRAASVGARGRGNRGWLGHNGGESRRITAARQRRTSGRHPAYDSAAKALVPRPPAFHTAPARRNPTLKILIAITGASGALYAQRLLDHLDPRTHDIHVVLSHYAPQVLAKELPAGLRLPAGARTHDRHSMNAPFASGSNPPDAMVVIPCTMGTLGRIAHGASDDLLLRAADVVLKEKKKLILVPRETPLNLVHVKNFELLLLAGATILPANPGFYAGAKTIVDLADTVVARVLDHLGVANQLAPRWQEAPE
ncbi:MAG: putative aromatic acid decarboxylase [Verrucomicrobia bacterium ADurb.Bin118]|nr:MAG: putative aromatic acid decarboxylase [Verrucomicrobia bacterium ADurb.Bin118]